MGGSVWRVGTRRCSRAGCSRTATSTLTYVYRDSTAVLGPLATRAEPHGYDLCQHHAQALSAPRGWEVIRLVTDSEPQPSTDDLLALADAVREVGLSYDAPAHAGGGTRLRSAAASSSSAVAATSPCWPIARTDGPVGIVRLATKCGRSVIAPRIRR